MTYKNNHIPLTSSQERILFKKLNRTLDNNSRALIMDKIIEANLGLVLNAVKKYYKATSLDFEDLVSEGMTGLIEAINKFDLSMGGRFSTYAYNWVLQRIFRAIVHYEGALTSSVQLNEITFNIQKESSLYYNKHGEYPSSEYLAKKCKLQPKRVEEALRNSQNVLSLDAPYVSVKTGESMAAMGELIEDDSIISCDEGLEKSLKSKIIDDCLDTLPEREKFVIIHLFGLHGHRPKTLQEVSGLLGQLSRERVRQIENSALKKLRNPLRSAKLRDFVFGD